MSSMGMRRWAFVALVVAGVVVLGLGWPDLGSRDTDITGRSGDSRTTMANEPAAHPATDTPPATEGRASIPASPIAAEAARQNSRPPVRLEMHGPSDVRVGEVFQARVDIDAGVAVRDFMFSVAYENTRLVLLRQSEGEFVRQPTVPADFGVDEPSDGNVTVVYNARNGSSVSGLGTVIVFEF